MATRLAAVTFRDRMKSASPGDARSRYSVWNGAVAPLAPPSSYPFQKFWMSLVTNSARSGSATSVDRSVDGPVDESLPHAAAIATNAIDATVRSQRPLSCDLWIRIMSRGEPDIYTHSSRRRGRSRASTDRSHELPDWPSL